MGSSSVGGRGGRDRIIERWSTCESTTFNQLPRMETTSLTTLILRRPQDLCVKPDENMFIFTGDQTEMIAGRQSMLAAQESVPPSNRPVPVFNLLPPSECFVPAAVMPKERIVADCAGAANLLRAMSDYNLDDDDCAFLEKERAARIEVGLQPQTFDQDIFEALLDAFSASKKPVTKMVDALLLAPRTADMDAAEAALRHWQQKVGKEDVLKKHEIGTYPRDRPNDPYVVFRPRIPPSPATRSTTRAKRKKAKDERGSEILKKKASAIRDFLTKKLEVARQFLLTAVKDRDQVIGKFITFSSVEVKDELLLCEGPPYEP